MQLLASGHISKMKSAFNAPVNYSLPVNEKLVDMNKLLGERITLTFNGNISCQHCGKKTKKSFAQGYCYHCMITLAQCDSCIMSPEKCHYAAGTCREPEWGEANCMIDHFVYLANSSGLKVGITRHSQIPTRWIDQGAVQALPIFRVSSRYLSGLVEVIFKQHIADRTDWRKMLKNDNVHIDLAFERDRLLQETQAEIDVLIQQHGLNAVQSMTDAEITTIEFPVIEYPVKVSSLDFEKTPTISGKVMGIKGQYLMLDCGVLNLRKFTSYHLDIYQG